MSSIMILIENIYFFYRFLDFAIKLIQNSVTEYFPNVVISSPLSKACTIYHSWNRH